MRSSCLDKRIRTLFNAIAQSEMRRWALYPKILDDRRRLEMCRNSERLRRISPVAPTAAQGSSLLGNTAFQHLEFAADRMSGYVSSGSIAALENCASQYVGLIFVVRSAS